MSDVSERIAARLDTLDGIAARAGVGCIHPFTTVEEASFAGVFSPRGVIPLIAGLREIVALHKPGIVVFNGAKVDGCTEDAHRGVCPTVLAVAKALGVES